jgi:hypothetical protein
MTFHISNNKLLISYIYIFNNKLKFFGAEKLCMTVIVHSKFYYLIPSLIIIIIRDCFIKNYILLQQITKILVIKYL